VSGLVEDYAALVASASGRYPGRWAQGWARGKMSSDPVYRAVLERLHPRGTLVDVGCGEGYLLALARLAMPEVDLVGLDHDERRLALARAALQDDERVRLLAEDARNIDISDVQAITLLDVLHYLPPVEQDALVAQLADTLRPGGMLLARDASLNGGWRSHVTQWSERFMVAAGRHKGQGVYLRTQDEIRASLAAAGLSVDVVPCHDGTPFANLLYIGTRVNP
jgi:SAM-dependent methyltransferase